MDGLAEAAGHADRATPLKMYCVGLLLPGERKSVEPMAARLAPDNVRRMHQSLHHVVADAPWSDKAVLAEVRSYALTAMRQKRPSAGLDRGIHRFPKERNAFRWAWCGSIVGRWHPRIAVCSRNHVLGERLGAG